jgi:hypothetical protein
MVTLGRSEIKPARRAWLGLAAAVLVVGAFATPALAQSGPTPEELRMRLERWKALSPDKRQELIDRYRAFNALPRKQQFQLQRSFQRWNNSDSATRRHMLHRWKQYQGLSPDKKKDFQRRWRKWQAMKAEDKARLKQKFKKFKALPADKRRDIIDLYRQGRRPPGARPFPRPGPPARPPGAAPQGLR